MLPSSKASWGSKTESERKQRGHPCSYNLLLFVNLKSCDEFVVKYTHIVSLNNYTHGISFLNLIKTSGAYIFNCLCYCIYGDCNLSFFSYFWVRPIQFCLQHSCLSCAALWYTVRISEVQQSWAHQPVWIIKVGLFLSPIRILSYI